MNRWTLASLTCLAILPAAHVSACKASAPADELEEDHSLASKHVTPHKPWGRDYAGGPVHALFFVHAGYSSGEWKGMY
jgi:hypothetical protein